MKGKKACYNCLHGNFVGGYPDTYEEPGEPDGYECINDRVDEDLLFSIGDRYNWDDKAYEMIAKECGEYTPRKIEKCKNCKKPMNENMYSWGLWAEDMWNGEVAVCSEKCKEEWKIKNIETMKTYDMEE